MRNIIPFNCILYDINTEKFIPYNIMPYLISEYQQLSKAKKPKTFEEFKEFIKREGFRMWWSRCEYEIILSDWPPSNVAEKWDVWKQIEMNLDLIVRLFMDNVKN